MKDFYTLAAQRFTMRKYTEREISQETLEKILSVSNLAPTAKNLQPQRIYVIRGEENLAKVDQVSPCRYGAKTVLLFAYDSEEDWKNPLEEGIHSGITDVSIVATHVMLQAADLGVDTTWVAHFANSRAAEIFGLPEREKAVLLMPMGYGDESYHPAPGHTEKKALEQTVRYL